MVHKITSYVGVWSMGSSARKMASCQKCSRPTRICHRMETECRTEAEKEALVRRLDKAR